MRALLDAFFGYVTVRVFKACCSMRIWLIFEYITACIFDRVTVRVCEGITVRDFGYMTVRVFGYVVVHIFGYVTIRVFVYVTVHVFKARCGTCMQFVYECITECIARVLL